MFTFFVKSSMAFIVPIIYFEDNRNMRIIRQYLRDAMNPFDISEFLLVHFSSFLFLIFSIIVF